ncbi:hypothetical protein MMC11_004120 [Xylographa trunciseda]|nr:hypothetical protein [Xylographa trunciseda]
MLILSFLALALFLAQTSCLMRSFHTLDTDSALVSRRAESDLDHIYYHLRRWAEADGKDKDSTATTSGLSGAAARAAKAKATREGQRKLGQQQTQALHITPPPSRPASHEHPVVEPHNVPLPSSRPPTPPPSPHQEPVHYPPNPPSPATGPGGLPAPNTQAAPKPGRWQKPEPGASVIAAAAGALTIGSFIPQAHAVAEPLRYAAGGLASISAGLKIKDKWGKSKRGLLRVRGQDGRVWLMRRDVLRELMEKE